MSQQNVIQTKQKISAIALEVFLILIAVLLGLLANEIRLNQIKKKQTRQVMNYNVVELQENAKSVETMIPYHQSMKDSLNALVAKIMLQADYDPIFLDLIRACTAGISHSAATNNEVAIVKQHRIAQ